MLPCTLGTPVGKFNDDRLASTLDAIQPHSQNIWQAVTRQALVQAQLDLSFIFYDLTAYVTHDSYPDNEYVDCGFAHNAPIGKRKFKTGQDTLPVWRPSRRTWNSWRVS